jgi:hypothetical protein
MPARFAAVRAQRLVPSGTSAAARCGRRAGRSHARTSLDVSPGLRPEPESRCRGFPRCLVSNETRSGVSISEGTLAMRDGPSTACLVLGARIQHQPPSTARRRNIRPNFCRAVLARLLRACRSWLGLAPWARVARDAGGSPSQDARTATRHLSRKRRERGSFSRRASTRSRGAGGANFAPCCRAHPHRRPEPRDSLCGHGRAYQEEVQRRAAAHAMRKIHRCARLL